MNQNEFISEPIRPDPLTFDTDAIARAEPGLPAGFTWRDAHHNVLRVLNAWKTSVAADGAERYLARHWWTIQTDHGQTLTIYCIRRLGKAGSRAARKRWFVYTIHHG